MINEEAIKTIKHGCIYRDKRGGEALEVAVNALEKQTPKKVIPYNKFERHCECGAIVKSYCKTVISAVKH